MDQGTTRSALPLNRQGQVAAQGGGIEGERQAGRQATQGEGGAGMSDPNSDQFEPGSDAVFRHATGTKGDGRAVRGGQGRSCHSEAGKGLRWYHYRKSASAALWARSIAIMFVLLVGIAAGQFLGGVAVAILVAVWWK